MVRVFGCAALLTALMTSVVHAADFTASNGATLRAPNIDTLNCAQRGTLLMEYSMSEYRGTAPLTQGHPDLPIYEYENQLAQRFYTDCQAGNSQFENSAPAFSHGFN